MRSPLVEQLSPNEKRVCDHGFPRGAHVPIFETNNRISLAGRRQDFELVAPRDLHHVRNVLLLLKTQRTNLLKESFEA